MMKTEVVTVKRDVFIGDEQIAEGTELMVGESDSEYYTVERDCLPDRVKRKLRGDHPVVIHRNFVTKPKVIEPVNTRDLMSVLGGEMKYGF